MSTRTQERGLNWTLEERNFLLVLIEGKKDVIENKQSDFASVHERNQVWLDIAKQYNTAYPPGRDAQKIKEQYQRLKSNAKKEIMEYHKLARIKPSASPPSELSLRISMLAPNDFKAAPCCWDSEPHGKSLSSSNDRDGSAITNEDLCEGTHMLVTPKTEIDADSGDVWETAETYHVVANGSRSRHDSDFAEQSSGTSGSGSAWHQDALHAPPHSLEKIRAQENPVKKRSLSMLEKMTAERLQTDGEPDYSLGKRKRLPDGTDYLSNFPECPEYCYNFLKAVHELKMKHLKAEHALRMEILTLKKRLIEKKIAVLDYRPATSSDIS